MSLMNPYTKGSFGYQRYETWFNAYKHWDFASLKDRLDVLMVKANDFLNSSTTQMYDAEQEARVVKDLMLAIEAIIEYKEEKGEISSKDA